jgi:cell division protease FtsH
MITVYGMSEKVGNVSFYDPQQEATFTKPYSEETGKIIDQEVRDLVDKAYQRTKALLIERKEEVEKIALALLEREVLHQQDVEDLIGKRPYEEKKIFASNEVEAIGVVTDSPKELPTSEINASSEVGTSEDPKPE